MRLLCYRFFFRIYYKWFLWNKFNCSLKSFSAFSEDTIGFLAFSIYSKVYKILCYSHQKFCKKGLQNFKLYGHISESDIDVIWHFINNTRSFSLLQKNEIIRQLSSKLGVRGNQKNSQAIMLWLVWKKVGQKFKFNLKQRLFTSFMIAK